MFIKEFFLVVAAIALTAFCWGVYGPVLHKGQGLMAGGHAVSPSEQGRLRPLICVGVAYFLIAIVVPLVMIYGLGIERDKGFNPGSGGILWSLAAGAAGAIGALGIILAFSFGGKPMYVMPLVFGCAPVVNAFWTIYWAGAWNKTNPVFYAGLILVAVGAVTVLFTIPKAERTAETTHAKQTAAETQ